MLVMWLGVLNAPLEHFCGPGIQKIGKTDVLLDNEYGIPKSLLS